MPAPQDKAGGNSGLSKLSRQVEGLNARLDRLERLQEDQHLLVMKFLIVRSISILSLLVEQSSAPPRIIAEAQEVAGEVTRKISQAKDLEELRALDIQLQNQLRGIIGAFKRA